MARPSWLVDSNRIATKIRSASGISDPEKVKWDSNPSRACPNCQHIIDNSDAAQEWPGLPRGVKFDPSDQEIIWHLLAKVGEGSLKSHPFIDEFILTVNENDGICCAHPQNLPGVKQDGSVSHFFHRSIKAYNTGTRKRRKILGEDSGDVRWHKTGRTKSVILDGVQRGCKKIMVLYMSMARGEKAEKTNWVMHQYHLGVEEDEKDGEYVISKIFYQQQHVKQTDKFEQDFPEGADAMIMKVDPVTPKLVIPEPPRLEMQHPDSHLVQKDSPAVMEMQDPDSSLVLKDSLAVMEMQHPDSDLVQKDSLAVMVPCAQEMNIIEDYIQPVTENHDPRDYLGEEVEHVPGHVEENIDDHVGEDPKWWDSESQYLLDSQQLVEGLSLCDDLLQSQSPNRDEDLNNCESKGKPRLADYAQLGPEDLKKDLEACQNLVIDPANIELDTPPDFRLSQLEFCSQESFIAWGGKNVAD